MSSQKALVLEKKQGPFVLKNNFPIPKLQPGHLLVKVQAVALNPSDWKIQAFVFGVTDYPAVLGTDIAGDVVEIAEGVEGFVRGDRVFFQGLITNKYAGFQEYTTIPTDIVGKIPANLTYAEAATVPLAFTTAALGTFAAKPTGCGFNPTLDPSVKYPDDPVLVIGGSTSVGQYAIQLFKYHGFKTIITTASKRHEAYLKSLGATHFIDRHEVPVTQLPATVKKITSARFKIVYDTVGGAPNQKAGYAVLAAGGQLVTVLGSNIEEEEEGKTVLHVWGVSHAPAGNREFGKVLWGKLPKYIEEGVIKPNRVELLRNGLAGIVDGLEKMKKDEVSGVKLVALLPETP